MAAGSRKKSRAQHPGSSGDFERGVHGALTKLAVRKIAKHEKIENSLKIFRRVSHEKYFVKINRQEITGTKKPRLRGFMIVVLYQFKAVFNDLSVT